MIKNYELICLISAKIDEIERDTVIENINKLVKEKGGEIMKTSSAPEISLGYPIKKQEKARLIVFNFKYENQNLAGLKKEIEKDQKILRCLLKQESVKKIISPPRKRGKKEEKVELKDIDRKIEEIFNPAGDTTKNIPGEVNLKNNEPQ
jgi:ribosomal protein S6